MKTRSGVMLLEVVLALAITALVLTGGGVALRTMSQVSSSVRRTSNAGQRTRNQEQLLRRLGRMATQSDTMASARGSELAFAFPSTCMTSFGWSIACSVTIVGNNGTTNSAAFRISTSLADTLMYATGAGHIHYLIDANNGGSWRADWIDTLRLPMAIELNTASDSLFIRLGSGVLR
jgi:hypothetical protein